MDLARPRYDRDTFDNLNAHNKWIYNQLSVMNTNTHDQHVKVRDEILKQQGWSYNANNKYITCLVSFLARKMDDGLWPWLTEHEFCKSEDPDDIFNEFKQRSLEGDTTNSSSIGQWNSNKTLMSSIEAIEQKLDNVTKFLLNCTNIDRDQDNNTNQTDYTSMLDAMDKKMTAMDKKWQSNQQDISTFQS